MSEIESARTAAERLAPQIRQLGETADQERRLPDALVELMRGAGLFRILQPRLYGGLELGMLDALDVIETVTAADGAAGWCLLKVASTNQLAAYLPEAGAREIWRSPGCITAGSFNPRGRATPVAGGYRLSGRWNWGTGTTFSDWIMAGAVIGDRGAGPPLVRSFFVEQKDVSLIDTWRTHGLRGTGSVDFVIDDVFVPEMRSFDGPSALPVVRSDLTLVPLAAQLAVPHAAVALGLARAAIDAFGALARNKTPLMASAPLAEDRLTHDQFGRACAAVNSARAYVRSAVSQAWSEARAGGLTPAGASALGLAPVEATHACVAAVDRLYTLSGGSAVFEDSPIQRLWRDLHVAASHVLVSHDKYAAAGRAALTNPEVLAGSAARAAA